MRRKDIAFRPHIARTLTLLVGLLIFGLGSPAIARDGGDGQYGYERLADALARYRQAAGGDEPSPVSPGPALKLGAKGERVVALRQRLAVAATAEGAGGMASLLGSEDVSEVFDLSLEMAVRDFQERHGLAADGVVGASTLAEVNRTAEEQIRRIELNLERWAELPEDFGGRYILVNIAAFRLDAFEDGRPVLDLKAIVGRTDTRTPVISSAIRDVVINPSWYVPAKIASNELLPKGQDYLDRNGFEILPDGKLRQRPGPNNSLGQFKFLFPNPFDVYLHDTSARSLFDRSARALSHGCVRIERPDELAAWVLRDAPQWSEDAIQDTLDSGREKRVRLPEPIPVHIVYWTAWVDNSGALRFSPDVYGQDREALIARSAGTDRRKTLTASGPSTGARTAETVASREQR